METKENNNTASTHQEKARKLKKLRRWQIVVSLLGIAILIWGIIQVTCLFLNYKRTETSNDAQIEQYISPVNLRASGYIKKICFTEHQEVHKGDTLLILDDREYKIRVMEAEAALKDAQAGATVIGATLQTTQTTASVYDASIAEIEIRLTKLENDRQRYQNLVKRNAATPIQLEQIETEYAATQLVRDLMKEWNGVGHVPFKEKDRIYKQYHSQVDKLFERFNISASNKKLSNFKSTISSIQEGSPQALYREREKLVRAFDNMKNELQTYENNLGFLTTSSKKGNSLLTEINRKVEKLKADIELVKEKIKVVDENIKNQG